VEDVGAEVEDHVEHAGLVAFVKEIYGLKEKVKKQLRLYKKFGCYLFEIRVTLSGIKVIHKGEISH